MTDMPESNHISNDQIDPDHSKPLDVLTWSDHPEINKLVRILSFCISICCNCLVFTRTRILT